MKESESEQEWGLDSCFSLFFCSDNADKYMGRGVDDIGAARR